MKTFFSCDWGTSAFRLRLVDSQTQTVLSEVKTHYGIASAFEHWKQAGEDQSNRVSFYQNYLSEQVKNVSMLFRDSVQDIPLVLSGMASSSIGMLELPYRQMPFQCDGSDLHVHVVTQEQGIQHKVLIISGVRSEEDVIRGEETMMAGCPVAKDDRQQLFIFPGTHSKHMMVRNAVVENFSTYMTGELFDLLSNKSILSASMKKSTSLTHDINGYFTRGVIKGASSNIMNSIFHVRTNQLFKKATPEENYQYLSGLLIGHELQYVAGTRPALITLVCSEGLKSHYYQALTALGLADLLHYHNADDALIRGQLNIMKLKAV